MSEKMKIDALGAYELLEKVVAERGEDFIYRAQPHQRCTYVHLESGEFVPGCAVGLAATFAGISLGTLRRWDSQGNIMIVGQDVFDERAVRVLRVFQRAQDSRARYGDALAAARAVLDGR